HELTLEDRITALDPPVECCCHPAQRRMSDLFLNVDDHLSGIGLIPAPVQLLGRIAKLNHEIARQVLGLGFAALLPPEPNKGALVLAHNNVGVRSSYEVATLTSFFTFWRIA